MTSSHLIFSPYDIYFHCLTSCYILYCTSALMMIPTKWPLIRQGHHSVCMGSNFPAESSAKLWNSLLEQPRRLWWCTQSSLTRSTTARVCFMGCRLCMCVSTTKCPQLRCMSGAEDDEVSTYHRSCPRSAPLAACETTCGVQCQCQS